MQKMKPIPALSCASKCEIFAVVECEFECLLCFHTLTFFRQDERLELCWLSCRTGDGVDQFMESFTSHLERL